MYKKNIIYWIFLSYAFSNALQRVDVEDISSNRILSATQDSSGFIWIGTDEGLNRFDGFSNKIYRSNIFNEKTISGNRIWITHIDKQNTLWVATDRGLCYYNKDFDEFHRINTGSKPLHVLEEEEEIFFTTSNNGVFKVSKKNKESTNYQFDPLDPFSLSSSKFSENQTNPIVKRGDVLWVGTTNGLNQINIKTGQTKRYYSGKTSFVKADTVTTLLLVGDILHIGTTEGLARLNLTTNQQVETNEEDLIGAHILSVFEIKEIESVGVVLNNKIILLQGNTKKQTITTSAPLKKIIDLQTGQYILSSNKHQTVLFININNGLVKPTTTPVPSNVEDLFTDKEGGLWVVGEKGLFRATNTTSPIKIYSKVKTTPGSFSTTKTNIFALKDRSILKYDTKTVLINTIETQANTDNKNIYVSDENRIFLYEKNIEEIKEGGERVEIASFKTPINTVFSKENKMFLSLKNSGIVFCDLKNNTTTDYRKNRLLSKNLPSGASTFLLDGPTLWLGNDESGLYELDVANPKTPKLLQHHTYNKNNPRSFSSSSVSCLAKHSELLFVGTSGDGIYIYKEKGFDRFTIDNGLPSNNIISFTPSSDSTIWVLTNSGVSLVNWKENSLNNVSAEEGLSPYYGQQNALIPKNNGDVIIVSPSGLQEVGVGRLYTNEYEPTVVIESVELIDKQNKRHKVKKTNIQATHATPIIRINLTAPAIYKAKNTTFSYFIENYHSEWVDNGTRRYLELQGLKPGVHKVKVKSYNNDGFESINIAVLKFEIIPPWWETWWAYLSYVLLVASGVFYYVKYQTKAQQKAAEDQRKEEELEEARQFQLDMLPKETPKDLGLDISATIQTASEVGGDYYDYFPQEDKESLYVVVGDATGHGMTAGMMVSITKAGLYGIPSIPPNEIAKRLNTVIKAIDLGWNRMAFNMARFWDNRVEFTSAAMPPAYHYHGETGEVDEILLGGLPLGSIKDETFTLEEFPFEKGDSLVFLSDGLPEATNKIDEMLGYEAVLECVKVNGEKNAEGQRDALLELGTTWLEGLQNQDDITIVVVKKTNPLD